jgi:hypothetical protein
MSILLNALNKAKQQSNEISEIEQLIEVPLDEAELEETEPGVRNVSFQQGLLVLLSLIVVLLLGILGVLIFDYFDRESQLKPQTLSGYDARRKPVASNIGEEVTNNNSPSLVNNNDTQSSLNTTTQNATADLSGRVEGSLTNSATDSQANLSTAETAHQNSRFFEQYHPRRETVTQSQFVSQSPVASRSASQTVTEVKNPKKTTALNTDLPLKLFDQLSDVEQMMVNEVNIDAHVYSEDPQQRFIFVDGQLKQEGDQLINSWVLEQILEDGVIINNGILRVKRVP